MSTALEMVDTYASLIASKRREIAEALAEIEDLSRRLIEAAADAQSEIKP